MKGARSPWLANMGLSGAIAERGGSGSVVTGQWGVSLSSVE